MQEIAALATRLIDNVEQVIVGKRAEIELVVIALLARGHVLLEDVPGTGKTMLARAVATSLGADFKRVQCTPDLLPADITGTSVFNPKTAEFEFRPGPVFVGVLLADEVNRATPRTQAALLEAMQERQVSADGVTRPLPEPFLVLATQNPIEYEGTFPLPEAQVDRFLMRISLGYPSPEEEAALLSRIGTTHPVESLGPVIDAGEYRRAVEQAAEVHVSPEIARYIVRLTGATRTDPSVVLGVSPRGSLALHRAIQVRAAMHDRDYAVPDDVKTLAGPVMGHRIVLAADAQLRGVTSPAVVARLLDSVPVHDDP